MIAIDTNVLLRYLLQDDVAQSRRATRLFENHDAILITDVVISETVWVLIGTKYRMSEADVVSMIHALIREPAVQFEDSQLMWRALSLYRRAPARRGKSADLADVLILLKARTLVESRRLEFEGWYTFDRGAQLLSGAVVP